jgi:hypothetical protein
MATLTYEDGIFEIDSFFNSSPTQANTITKAETGKDAQDAGVPTGQQTALPSAQTDPKQDTQSVVPTTEQPPDTDEFATLIEDHDQVTAREAVLTNPKGQLHFILNNPTSPSPKHSKPASPMVEKPVVDRNIVEPGAASTDIGSPQFGQRQTGEGPQPAPGLDGGTHFSPATNSLTNAADSTIPLASGHSEKGLTLLSPRPSQPTNPQPLSVIAPPQRNAANDSLRITSPNINNRPQLPSLSQAPAIEPAMSGTSPPIAKSPDLPSSDGKASLTEEM